MSQPQHASQPFDAAESSGIRAISAALAEARRVWEYEDRLEEAAELAMFEWHLFLTELDPAPPPLFLTALDAASPSPRVDRMSA